jgi:hypothetical protein
MKLAKWTDMDIAGIPKIQIVAADCLHSYERAEGAEGGQENSAALIHHPFLATEIGGGDFLLLEKTTEVQACVDAGLEHLPVQVCSFGEISVKSRRLGLIRFDGDDLVRLCSRYPDQIVLSRDGGQAENPPAGFLTVRFEFDGADPISVYLRNSSQIGCPLALENLFNAISEKGRYVPVLDRRRRSEVIAGAALPSGYVETPAFSLSDLKIAVTADRLFPAGLLDIRVNRRVLNIDYPTTVLRSEISIDEKDLFLRDLIALREQNRRTSFYRGQVFLLNH